MRAFLVSVIVFGTLSLSADKALCVKNEKKEATRQLKIGQQKYDEGQFQQAAEAFLRSYTLDKNYEAAYGLSQSQVGMGNYAAAIDLLTQYLQQSGEDVTKAQRQIVEKEIERLKFLSGQVNKPGGQQPANTQPQPAATQQPIPAQDAALHVQLGLTYQQQGRFDLAQIEFNKAYALSSDFNTLYLLGKTEVQLQQNQKASETFKRFLAEGGANIDPARRSEAEQEIQRLDAVEAQSANQQKALNLFQQGKDLFSGGKYQRAKQMFSKGYDTFPRPEFLYFLGKASLQLGQKKEAYDFFNNFLKTGGSQISPAEQTEVSNQLQQLYAEIQQSSQVEESESFRKEALEWHKNGDYQKAVEILKQAYQVYPNFEILYDIGQSAQSAKQYIEARGAYERYLTDGADKVSSKQRKKVQKLILEVTQLETNAAERKKSIERYNNGLNLCREKRFEEALVEFEESYKINRDYRVLSGTARALIALERYDQALTAYEQYLKKGDRNITPERRAEIETSAKWLRGVVKSLALYSKNKFPEAQLEFDNALALFANFHLLYYIGRIASSLTQHERAMDAYKRYLARGGSQILNSRRSEVELEIERLAPIIKDAQRKEESLRLFDEAKQWLDDGQFDQASKLFKKAYKLNADFEIFFYLAQAEDRSGNYKEARTSYERYLSEGQDQISKKQRVDVQAEIDRLIALQTEEENKKKSNVNYKRGYKLLRESKFQSALSEFEKAYKLNQDYRILEGVAKSAAGLKRYALAISAYERYLSDGGDKISSTKRIEAETEVERLQEVEADEAKKQEALEHYKAGTSLRTRGSLDQALAEFNKAYEIKPSYKILYEIAKTQAALNNNEKAIETYGSYLEEGGDAISESQRKKTEKEIARLRANIERAEQQASSKEQFQEGLALKTKNKCKEAVVEFEEAYKLDPNYEILLPTAECNAKLKDYQKAIENYNLYLFKGGANVDQKQRKRIEKEKERLVSKIKKKK